MKERLAQLEAMHAAVEQQQQVREHDLRQKQAFAAFTDLRQVPSDHGDETASESGNSGSLAGYGFGDSTYEYMSFGDADDIEEEDSASCSDHYKLTPEQEAVLAQRFEELAALRVCPLLLFCARVLILTQNSVAVGPAAGFADSTAD